jgi:3-hydroxyacyl-[acyl-carrier-protein] dehydratase
VDDTLANAFTYRYKFAFSQVLPGGIGVKFNLVDKVEHLSEQRIVAVKYVSLAEEYLADHFPTFPVLPGVMMLETAVQAAGWLLHHRTGFSRSLAVLKEARNVKYGQFVAPGNFLRMDVELLKPAEGGATFKATGTAGASQAVQMRLELSYFNLAEKNPELAELDARLIEHHRRRWDVLRHQSADVSMATA